MTASIPLQRRTDEASNTTLTRCGRSPAELKRIRHIVLLTNCPDYRSVPVVATPQHGDPSARLARLLVRLDQEFGERPELQRDWDPAQFAAGLWHGGE